MSYVLKVLPYALGILLGYFSWPLVEMVFDGAESADVRILSAAISAAAVLVATLVAQTFSHRREMQAQEAIRLREIEDSLRERKVQAYSGLLDLVSSYMQGGNQSSRKKTPSLQKTLDEIEKFQNAIMLWGGPKVIHAYLEYRKHSQGETGEMFRHIDQLYLSIRADIGLSNEGLDSHELLKIYMEKPEEIDQLLGDA